MAMTPLIQYIRATGFEAVQALILGRALPCFHVFADGDARQAPLGRTRLGGTPDLPAGVDWPRDDEGKLGNFFGQFDLADLAQRVNDPALPREGLLSLFMTCYMSAGDPVIVKALLTAAGAALVRHAAPESEDDFADPDTGLLEAVNLRFEPGFSLPFHARDFRCALESAAPAAETHMLQNAVERADAEGLLGQLLGYAAPGDGTDFYRALHFHRTGRGGLQYLDHWDTWTDFEASEARNVKTGLNLRKKSPRDLNHIRWLCDHLDEITEAASQWRLLLRIDSNKAMRFNMNDWDPIYFFMPATDLARGNFERVEAGVTQG
jgi:hypothetical protein